MKMRVSIGVLGCALFVAAPAFAQDPVETPAAEAPAATAGPGESEHPAPAAEPVAATEPTAEMTAGTEVGPPTEPVVESEEQHGFELGVRIAYGIPMGGATKAQSSLDEDVDLSDVVAGLLPIQLDLGYRINNHLFVGGYGSYAFGFKPDLCDETGAPECDSPSQVRVGGQVLFNILPVTHAMSPWIGAGIGYEWLNGPVFDGQLHGMEFFNVQAGVDFRLADHMRLGPYAQFSLGQYSTTSATVLGEDVSNDLDDKATHEWLDFGLKATFGAFGGD